MSKQATPTIRAKVTKLAKCKRLRKRLDELEARLVEEVKTYIGDPNVLMFNDEKLATLTEVVRTNVDTKKLRSEFAEVWAECKRESVSLVLNLA